MRNPEPNHKKIYVRFHRQLDLIIEDFAKKAGMRRATAVAWVINHYMSNLMGSIPDIEKITKTQLGFIPEGEAYYLRIGRSDEGRIAGKRTLLTLDNVTDRNIRYLAAKTGLTPSQLRTEILVKYFLETKQKDS